MRYAILSDIHANLEAFRAVLDRVAGLGVDVIACLGDLVGYNADPNACVDLIRDRSIACVLGNHDAVACGLEEPDSFTPLAQRAILWTREALTAATREFLRGLPRRLQVPDLVLCHGSVDDTNRYVLTTSDARECFSEMQALSGPPRICFVGHTHTADAFSLDGPVLAREAADTLNCLPDRTYLVNPGAVGQPRDGDPRAAFLVYDTVSRQVSFHRSEYDIAACQRKIIAAGLPPRLAERLMVGR